MKLLIDGTELPVAAGFILSASYQPREAGIGTLKLHCTNAVTFEEVSVSIPLDPWCPEGYLVEQGISGRVLILCGATQLLVIELPPLRITASIPLEYEECETRGLPWFVVKDDLVLIATETRIFCLDQRLAFRWCWTAAVHSRDGWVIAEKPRIEGSVAEVSLAAVMKTVNVKLDLVTAAEIL